MMMMMMMTTIAMMASKKTKDQKGSVDGLSTKTEEQHYEVIFTSELTY